MYIKQVIIKGFKSYKDQTIIEPFHPKHNVIVGRNGSGKSNFFSAIRFVLSDMFSTLRADERQKLLHEGPGLAVMSAYVEIIFDNSDGRIPIDKEEVTLRRTIGLKKDEYFLDNKHVNKSDVLNLLESSGFSRSNPYYIVQQGKVKDLALAKDEARLDLLKEVAGTSVYDERRRESLKILEDTASKRQRIEEVLVEIEQRLAELEEEKEELKEYQALDKDRRSIEYGIYNRELEDARAKLDDLEHARLAESERAQSSRQETQRYEDTIQDLEQRIAHARQILASAEREKRSLVQDKADKVKARTKLELDVADLERSSKDKESRNSQLRKDLKALEKRIAAKRKELDEVLPAFDAVASKEKEATTRKADCERVREELFAKQSRGSRFRSKAERDAFLTKEVASLEKDLTHRKAKTEQARKDLAASESKLAKVTEELAEREEAVADRKQLMEAAIADVSTHKARRDELTNERQRLWTAQQDVERRVGDALQAVGEHEKELMAGTNKATAEGLETVRRIVQEHKIAGVYGPLIELIQPEAPTYDTALDVSAQNMLFAVVTQTDEVASQILSIMNRQRMPGRVTFLPLNQMARTMQTIKYPERSDNYFPLITKLQYDPKFEPVVRSVVGRTLVCRDLQLASQQAKASEDLDCVTLSGDKHSRQNTLTGGFIDTQKSRFAAQRKLRAARDTLKAAQDEAEKLKSTLNNVDQSITVTGGEIVKLETRREQLHSAYRNLRTEIATLTEQVKTCKDEVERRSGHLATLTAEVATSTKSLDAIKSELGTELTSVLDESEATTLKKAADEIQTLSGRLVALLKEKTGLEGKKDTIESELNGNLLKKKAEIERELEEEAMEDREQSLDATRAELATVTDSLERVGKALAEAEEMHARSSDEIAQLTKALDDARTAERDHISASQNVEKTMEVLLTKRSLAQEKRDECMRKIRDLGSLPAEAFDKYATTSTKVLYEKLRKVTEKLAKYKHVNKKALDQYVSFSEQREALRARKDEQDAGDEAIHNLINVLDNQKDEAIIRTFKQVAKYFSEVFKDLVPQGHASLVMQTTGDKGDESSQAQSSQSQADEAEDDSGAAAASSGSRPAKKKSRVESYKGVSILVNFTGTGNDTHLISQLSGGQKSVVALALIFAIQRCDPAPFYLFDEIDQALDPLYRTSVAKMISAMSEKAQYITVSFRPELLQYADKCYGVTFENKVSHVTCVTKQDALDFVEEDKPEQ